MIYVKDDIPTKEVTFVNLPHDIERIFVEVNLVNWKWLCCGCYHPPGQQDEYLFNQLGNVLDQYTQNYEKFLIGDFSAEDTEPSLFEFSYECKVKVITSKAFCKSLQNPSCIDLFISNSPLSFQNVTAIFKGLSEPHQLVVTVRKQVFWENSPKEIYYRN